MDARLTDQCCRNGFDAPCRCAPACSAGACVNRPGICPMHCGCPQHTPSNPEAHP